MKAVEISREQHTVAEQHAETALLHQVCGCVRRCAELRVVTFAGQAFSHWRLFMALVAEAERHNTQTASRHADLVLLAKAMAAWKSLGAVHREVLVLRQEENASACNQPPFFRCRCWLGRNAKAKSGVRFCGARLPAG